MEEALIDGDERVRGVRLCDQGVDRDGNPEAGFMPGMDIHAALTVVGDGPVGAVGRQLDEEFGLPDGHHQREWAVGMKMVVDLPESYRRWSPARCSTPSAIPSRRSSASSTCIPDRVATVGIFVPSWFRSPMRTSYRYLQHFMLHPYLWRYLQGGKLRSWGAKSLQESGRRGEPFLAGNGYARIGEGSGSTNVLTGSGVDEAWTTGSQLAEAVLELLQRGQAVHARRTWRATYVARRRASWVEAGRPHRRKGARRLPPRRGHRPDGHGAGRLHRRQALASAASRSRCPSSQEYYRGKIPAAELDRIVEDCRSARRLVPRRPDGALRLARHSLRRPTAGHAPGRAADRRQSAGARRASPTTCASMYPDFCERCASKLCIEMCSGQAITPGPGRRPRVRPREVRALRRLPVELRRTQFEDDPPRGNITFTRRRGRAALDGELR